jgi:CubicO group peptidase (beta-lactamase class C family)
VFRGRDDRGGRCKPKETGAPVAPKRQNEGHPQVPGPEHGPDDERHQEGEDHGEAGEGQRERPDVVEHALDHDAGGAPGHHGGGEGGTGAPRAAAPGQTGCVADPLVPLPPQPPGVDWPTEEWPTGPVPQGVDLPPLLDEMFDDTERYGTTYAAVVVHRGRLVASRYGGVLEHWDGDGEPVGPGTRLLSWSMAKSVLHALVGILHREGRLTLDAPAPVPAWQEPGDPRAGITLEHLLTMRDGLAFREDYVDGQASEVIEMLFGAGADDVAAYAAERRLAHPPGGVFNYSSGTSNIVARIVGDVVGDGADAYGAFLRSELLDPLGMRSARPRFDAAGTFVASSYLFATARDFARFGLLYLRDGVWEGRRILPAGWVDHARRPRSLDPVDQRLYGAHWWVVGDELGGFWANGYEGQSILCVPALDLVVVRLGKSDRESYPALQRWRAAVTAAFRGAPGAPVGPTPGAEGR